MKKVSKLFVTALLLSLCYFGYGQVVKVNINNQEQTVNADCPYRINGICSTEDIGGVDATFIYEDKCTWLAFTNYNQVTVTILYEIGSKYENGWPVHRAADGHVYGFSVLYETPDKTCGSIVCRTGETKKIKIHQTFSSNYDHTVSCVDESQYYSLNGLIVRKLSK